MPTMRRREFILLAGAAATCPLAALAQQPSGRVFRIVILGATSPGPAQVMVNAFRDGMRERGYVEGQNLVIEYRAPGPSRTAAWRLISCAATTMSFSHGPHRPLSLPAARPRRSPSYSSGSPIPSAWA
jgi:hypothetical protein